MKSVKCRNCKWVHFERSLTEVSGEIIRFNNWYYTQTKEVQDMYGGNPSTISGYTSCHRCGASYKDFEDAMPDDMPYGSTIQPILSKEAEI